MQSSKSFSVTLVTVPSKEEGEKISRSLVEKDLAACVNIIPSVQSVYKWEGEINTDNEFLLIIKGRTDNLEALGKEVLQLHSYETPEVISFSIDKGNKEYLDWMNNTRN